MTAAAAYWPETGRLEALAVFPMRPGLLERGQRDGVGPLYERLAARGELTQAGDLSGVYPWSPGPGARPMGSAYDHRL